MAMPNMDKQLPTMNIEDQRLMVGPTKELEDDPLDITTLQETLDGQKLPHP